MGKWLQIPPFSVFQSRVSYCAVQRTGSACNSYCGDETISRTCSSALQAGGVDVHVDSQLSTFRTQWTVQHTHNTDKLKGKKVGINYP